MKIGALSPKGIYKQNTKSSADAGGKRHNENYISTSKNRDTVHISEGAYRKQIGGGEMSAASGKDNLGITGGTEENSYIIHFSDSAMVSRAVSRGYITVNGTRIDLSEEDKKQLLEVDKQAEADRMQAYNAYIMQHEAAVAQQQSEAYKKLAEDTSRVFEIMTKISSGKKVSGSEEKELMQFNPQMYAMAKNMAAMTKRHNNMQEKANIKEREAYNKEKGDIVQGVEWSQFEWKTYESQMTVSINNKGENNNAAIQGFSEGSVTLSEKGK